MRQHVYVNVAQAWTVLAAGCLLTCFWPQRLPSAIPGNQASLERLQQRLDAHHKPVGCSGDGRAPHRAAEADEDVSAAGLTRLSISRAVTYHHQRRVAVPRLPCQSNALLGGCWEALCVQSACAWGARARGACVGFF